MFKEIASLFLCGAFGGLAPTLLELAGLARRQDFPGSGFYIAMCIFALIGGGVALVYREKAPHKAFMLGVAAPALIVAAGTVIDSQPQQVNAMALLDLRLSSTAYAQEADLPGSSSVSGKEIPTAGSSGRELKVICNGFSPQGCTVEFRSTTGRSEKTILTTVVKDDEGLISVPVGADSVRVGDAYSESEPVELPRAGSATITAEREDTFLSGFYSAFGMNNRAESAKTTQVSLDVNAKSLNRSLRSEEATLSIEEIRTVIRDRGFYDLRNRLPSTFQNNYRVEVVGDLKVRVIVDDATGLMWLTLSDYRAFAEAEELRRVRNQDRFGGFNDWRIPTVEELLSILTGPIASKSGGFLPAVFEWKAREVWSRDRAESSPKRWYVDFSRGDLDSRNPTEAPAEVFLVRTMSGRAS
jgi:serine/threonine-protein kinase